MEIMGQGEGSRLVREDCQAKKSIKVEERMTECLCIMKRWSRVEGRRAQLEELPLMTCYPRRCQGAPSEVGRHPSYRVKEPRGCWTSHLHTGVPQL